MRSVGVDIGTYSVKVCAVDHGSKGLVLTHFVEHPLTTNTQFDRDLETIEFLRKVLPGFDPSKTKFTFSIRQDRISVRLKSFPFRDRSKIQRSLPFELEEELPLNPDDTIYDCRMSCFKGASAEVLAAAATKEAIRPAMQIISDSGVEAQNLTPEGFGLANIFEAWSEAPKSEADDLGDLETRPAKNCKVMVHIGHSKTLILLFDGKKLLDIRSLSFGGQNLALAISKKYEIAYSQALRQLQTNSFILLSPQGATQDQIFFSQLMESTLSELIRDLRLSIIEFRAQFHCDIGEILLSGGVSRLQNIGPFITQGLEVPVNRNPILNQFADVMFEKTAWNDAVCPVALGLAIEGLRKSINPPMNLLRGEFAKQSQAGKAIYEKWGLTIKYAGAMLVLLFIYSGIRESAALSMLDRAGEILKEQGKTVAKLSPTKSNEKNIKNYIKKQNTVVKSIENLTRAASITPAIDTLKAISNSLPTRSSLALEIRRLEIKGESILLEGYVNSTTDVSTVKNSLKSVASSNVQTNSTGLPPQPGKTPFRFNFDVTRTTSRGGK